jgi:GNAT superfamily N-acetyltransferase
MADHHAGERNFGSTAGPAVHHAQWQGAVREVRTSELHHYQWHLLRLRDGWHGSRCESFAFGAFQRWVGERLGDAGTAVLGCFVGGQMRGAAVLRSLQHDWSQGAEIVLSVEKAWQGRGIGTALMVEAMRVARERGIPHLYLSFHVLNRRVQRIAERFAAKIEFEDCGCFADITIREEPVASRRGPNSSHKGQQV